MTGVSDARYFVSSKFTVPTLLRRIDMTDEAFVDGAWRPTKAIVDWMFGHDDHVVEITEDEARTFALPAF